jgi:hypothetical protein
MTDSIDPIADRREIRELLENWVVWRDAGHWDRFRTVWHGDGVMMRFCRKFSHGRGLA